MTVNLMEKARENRVKALQTLQRHRSIVSLVGETGNRSRTAHIVFTSRRNSSPSGQLAA